MTEANEIQKALKELGERGDPVLVRERITGILNDMPRDVSSRPFYELSLNLILTIADHEARFSRLLDLARNLPPGSSWDELLGRVMDLAIDSADIIPDAARRKTELARCATSLPKSDFF